MITFSFHKNCATKDQPKKRDINTWLRHSLINTYKHVTLDISIVDIEESQQLNYQYRQKNCPTNVIAVEYPSTRVEFGILTGELILCDTIILHEATAQNKLPLAHYAHMVVHGMLHLQGLDHIVKSDQQSMEKLEIQILAKLGYANPYILMEII